jgi:hypothetical protein
MFSFGTGDILAPPPEHAFCKKGALVEIKMVNHQSDSSIFIAKGNIPKVEEMYHIFDNYGDTVKLLSASRADEARIEYPVDASGAAKVDPIFAHAANGPGAATGPAATTGTAVPSGVTELKAQLAKIMAAVNLIESGGGGTPNVEVGAEQAVTVGAEDDNPFHGAS